MAAISTHTFQVYLPGLLSSAVNPYSILISDNYIYRLNLSSVRSILGGLKLFGGEGVTLRRYYYSSPPILQKNKTPIQYAYE